MKSCLLMFAAVLILTCCQNKRSLHQFVRQHQSCQDTTITYYSGEKWQSLVTWDKSRYNWGKQQDSIYGKVTYLGQTLIGKGSVLVIDEQEWVVSKIKHNRYFSLGFKHGSTPYSLPNVPEKWDLQVQLHKLCN